MYRKQSFLFLVLILFSGMVWAQPKLTFHLGGGLYEPELTGFEDNTLMKEPGFFARSFLGGYGLMYEFYPNARIGFYRASSYQSGSMGGGTDYSRSLIYRSLKLETFFTFFGRFEANFVLAPMYNRGYISLSSKSSSADWDSMLSEYGNAAVSIDSEDAMTTKWWGFHSEIGVRYYFLSWLAFDLRTGFMQNGYDAKDWKFQGKKVNGPALKIGDLPVLTFQLIFKIK